MDVELLNLFFYLFHLIYEIIFSNKMLRKIRMTIINCSSNQMNYKNCYRTIRNNLKYTSTISKYNSKLLC